MDNHDRCSGALGPGICQGKYARATGDRVGRREVEDSIADLQSYIEVELDRALDNAVWRGKELEAQRLDPSELNGLVSDFADARFDKAPRLHNELLNRIKPSSNAIAARNVPASADGSQ